MFRRCLTRRHKAARPDHPAKPAGSGGMQRPGANVWMLRENITPGDVWKWLSETYFNHKVLGFAARCVVFGTVVSGSLLVLYRALVLAMENRPIAKQWVPRFRELTFIERIEEKGTEMSIYRFALPNSYDYLGYDSVSSVELMFDNDPFFPCRRWLTPISHPDQRGVVEFACKFHNPGEFSLKLWSLVPGDKVLMGPWIKEFKYAANKYKEIGIICANSGITPALQLLVRSLDDKNDTTKFSLLYCNASPATTPFYKKLREIEAKYPDRLKVTFAVSAPNLGTRGEEVVAPHATKQLQQHGWPSSSFSKSAIKGSVMAYDMGERGEIQPVKLFKVKDGDFEGYVGNVSRDLILETMPMPNDPNTKILCCGPQGMMSILCGRPQGWFRTTYFQGFYHGVLQEMGYPKSQVYKFGTSISLWMKFT